MAGTTITEIENYDETVYQIENDDMVMGGADGTANKSAKNLANRTKWLKAQVSALSHGVTPVGGIIMWKGSTVPSYWHLCDGGNGTPDLRGKFIVGANEPYLHIGATGGSDDTVLVSHTHGIQDAYYIESVASIAQNGSPTNTITIPNQSMGPGASDPDNTVLLYRDTTSGGVTGEAEPTDGKNTNYPPYYALAYIMRVS